ncbi:exopolyphosphatase [Parashewanella curva]|uniref:Exopolyphosphatase n=1 Tax=Parashewanella curva TaxID=2338552 RepID=A0A3L8Q2K5_9GAMM|nr:exopolyphosphatase [Parashewanella curva]RLV60662.1 exopolyphosphatase [Parashewanella curva]
MSRVLQKHFVAIDMGSNSFHLVIAREQDGSLQILHKEKQQVKLAQGLNHKNQLSQEAIERGVNCLKDFAQRFSELEQTQVRPVATHTLRVATNVNEFLQAARNVLPYPIEIISGHEEARLIYSGIAQNQVLTQRNLVIDIGGGSTEVVIGKKTKPTHLSSLRCGCVSFHEHFFHHGELTKEHFKAAMTAADKQLATLSKTYFNTEWTTVLGSSGSVKAIVEAVKEVVGETELTLKNLKALKQHLIECKNIEQVFFENVEDRRTLLIPAALAILISCFKRLSISNLSFASSALREGVLYELAKIGQYQDVQLRTVQSIAKLYHVDFNHAHKVSNMAMDLFEHVADEWGIRDQARLLGFAASLHEIGIHINSRQHQKHGSYIISNSDLPGFSEQLQSDLATLIANHRKTPSITHFQTLAPQHKQSLIYLTCILRIAVLSNLGRIGCKFDFNKAHASENTLTLSLPHATKQSQLFIKDLRREQKRLALLDIELELR